VLKVLSTLSESTEEPPRPINGRLWLSEKIEKAYHKLEGLQSARLLFAAGAMRGHDLISYEYPIPKASRFGNGLPPHPEIYALLDRGRDRYAQRLRAIIDMAPAFEGIPERATTDPTAPYWVNDFLPPMDSMALWQMLAEMEPTCYLEIGSGQSTRVARRAIAEQGLKTTVTSIDPHPRFEIDQLCDTVIRSRLEDVDQSIFGSLEAGDILFFDGSHRAFTGSDVSVFFLEILPRLTPGVIVHIHDIFLPNDYPTRWTRRAYSEQLMLATLLLFAKDQPTVLFPNQFISNDDELMDIVRRLLIRLDLWGLPRELRMGGSSFWFQL
jgi:hypothetical protein